MAIGLVVSVYLFGNIFGVYVGPIPNGNANLGDITFIVGFVLTAALYYVFNLNLRKQTAEKRASMGSRAA
jgi:purine-cytosine permease-like protein